MSYADFDRNVYRKKFAAMTSFELSWYFMNNQTFIINIKYKI